MTNNTTNYTSLVLRAKALADANRQAQADKEKREALAKKSAAS
jgi:hypothetical protein